MNYKDPITGELKPIHVKTADTLPIGTIVEYDGEGVPDGWEEVGTYFTDEQVIGKHPNGKTLYKRGVIDTTKNADLSVLNYDFLHIQSCSVVTQAFTFTGARYLGNGDTIECFINNNTKRLQTVLGTAWENSYVRTIAQLVYTKTTDTASNRKQIKKKATSIGVVAKTVNEKSDSKENVYSCEYINGKSIWTNSNPSVVFEAQTIELELSEYRYIEITYAYSIESLQYTKTVKVEIGKNSTLDYVSEGVNISCRNIQITTAGVHFDGNNLNGTINNVYCIPLSIKGYK